MRLFEINTRVHGESFDAVTEAELSELAALGFDALWPMGVWEISQGARHLSKIISEDFEGSPYAVPRYKFNKRLGGKDRFAALVRRAHRAGLAVIVDFVSNHMAIDSPWIEDRADLFVLSAPRARHQQTSEFFLHPSGEVVAFGRDPFFPPWNDTAQLDYSNPTTRERMIDTLLWISDYADGVRCDMAMLVLRDHFRRQWYPLATDEWFESRMPGEFWDEAIQTVKKRRPDFQFIAEAYWDQEAYLRALGFDLCYEKKLLDALAARDAAHVIKRLSLDEAALRASVFFIENHDEARAATIFNDAANLAAAALMLALPGSQLIHEGQMEGKREKLPVQRIKPLTDEVPNPALRQAYEQLLRLTAAQVFKRGSFRLFDSRVWGAVAFIRQDAEQAIGYLGQIAEAWHQFHSVAFDITPMALAIGARQHMIVTNLLTDTSLRVDAQDGAFTIRPEQIGAGAGTQFCFIAVSQA
ncbi:MAG TPA: alpha-amylase family glycosyl hydrolase [Blastocatellia bacterium]|nr:alpha-amylase family glycosyl hydrolase [Blastocatellia bacterium]